MLIVKSFLRKKSTKIYFIIFILLILVLLTLGYYNEKYINLANENYRGSYIQFTYSYDYKKKISKMNNIKEISLGIPYKENYEIYYFFQDINLSKNEIIINKNAFPNIQIGESITLNENNFIVKKLKEDQDTFDSIYLSEESWNKILKEDIITYRITLMDWTKREKTVEKIKKELNIYDDVTIYLSQKQEINFDKLVIVSSIVLMIIIFCFFIILITTLINIIYDEQKINKMYIYLGYTKGKLIRINIVKLFLLLSISYLTALSIYKSIILIFK